MQSDKSCLSCGLKIGAIAGSLSFKCPSCAELEISRCAKCRKAGRTYTCPSCGFTGP